ncbi:MAG: hypothetical protein Q4E61_04560, partial [Alphaproteobacteria bacterium]|nr:hypothetical protein [Alphaproteobacteria bacterium]
MGDKRIIYGGSKAIKITGDMKKALNAHVKTTDEFDIANQELFNLENTLAEKNKELEEVTLKSSSEDKKEAKEASKKLKVLEKEIEKANADVDLLQTKVQTLSEKKDKAQMTGTTFKTMSALNQKLNSTNEIVENSNVQETPVVENSGETQVFETKENVMPDIPIVSEENIGVPENTEVSDQAEASSPELPIVNEEGT